MIANILLVQLAWFENQIKLGKSELIKERDNLVSFLKQLGYL